MLLVVQGGCFNRIKSWRNMLQELIDPELISRANENSKIMGLRQILQKVMQNFTL